MNRVRSMRPTSQCEGQLILARVRGELAKNLAGGDDPRCDRRHDAQDVGPVRSMSGSLILPPTSARTLAGVALGVKAWESFLRRSRIRGRTCSRARRRRRTHDR
jgi:hypothetical protein